MQSHAANMDEIVEDSRWFLENIDTVRHTLSFVRADRAVLAKEPFLDQRWNRTGFDRVQLPLDALAARLPPQQEPPKLHAI